MYAALNPASKATRKTSVVEGGRRDVVERDGGRAMPLSRKGSTDFGVGSTAGAIEDEQPYCEGNLRIVEVLNGSEGDGDVMCIQYSPDGKLLAAGYSSGIIKVFSADNRRHCLHILSVSDLIRLPVTCIHFLSANPGERRERTHLLAASYASGCVRFWHYTSSTCLDMVVEDRESRETSSLAFNSDARLFAAVGADPQINLYDAQTKKRIRTFEATDSRYVMDGHRCRVYAVRFHPTDSHVFLTGGWDNTVQFWDDREAHSVRKIFGPHICGDSLDIDRLYGHILTGSWRKDEALQIWDYGSGEMIKNIPQDPMHSCQFYCAHWLGREDIACAGSSQNMTRVINRGTLDTIGTVVDLPQGVFCLDNNGQEPNPQLAAGAGDRIFIVQTGVLMSDS